MLKLYEKYTHFKKNIYNCNYNFSKLKTIGERYSINYVPSKL